MSVSLCLPVCLSVSLFLSLSLSVCLSVCLSLSLSLFQLDQFVRVAGHRLSCLTETGAMMSTLRGLSAFHKRSVYSRVRRTQN